MEQAIRDDERRFKCTNQHWSVCVNFFEQHPSLVCSKFTHPDGDAGVVKKLWAELAVQLNSLGFGSKSVEKWELKTGPTPGCSTWPLDDETSLPPLSALSPLTISGPATANVQVLYDESQREDHPRPSSHEHENMPKNPPVPSPLEGPSRNKRKASPRPGSEHRVPPPPRQRRIGNPQTRRFVTMSQMRNETMQVLRQLQGDVRNH